MHFAKNRKSTPPSPLPQPSAISLIMSCGLPSTSMAKPQLPGSMWRFRISSMTLLVFPDPAVPLASKWRSDESKAMPLPESNSRSRF